MTLTNKVITYHLILGTNPKVLNGHVKPFLENLCPKPQTFYVDIREQFKILYQCILWHHGIVFHRITG